MKFTPHKDIRKKGAEAFERGEPMESNPFRLLGMNKGGHFKAASWDAGWNEAKRVRDGRDS